MGLSGASKPGEIGGKPINFMKFHIEVERKGDIIHLQMREADDVLKGWRSNKVDVAVNVEGVDGVGVLDTVMSRVQEFIETRICNRL